MIPVTSRKAEAVRTRVLMIDIFRMRNAGRVLSIMELGVAQLKSVKSVIF